MLRLLIEDSEGKSKFAPITPESEEVTIGRKAGNTIRLKEQNVSREHAKIYQTEEGLFVAPVAARYGMKVNSNKIDGPTHIELGDEIRIGDYRIYVQDESQIQPVKEDAEASDVPVALPPDQQPRLVVISSNFAGREYPITSTRCVIGRAPESSICIQQNSVSSTHAEISRNRYGNFEIRDMGSSNGTKINGQDLGQNSHELQSGDMLALGHVFMRFCAPGELWYFNFGAAEPRKNTGLMIALVIALVAVAILGTAVFMMMLTQGDPQPSVAQDEAAMRELADLKNQNDLTNYIMSCNTEIANGNFDMAAEFCKKAEQINANDDRLEAAMATLRRERIAERKFQQIEDRINEHTVTRCREAFLAISEIDVTTFAYKLIVQKNYKERAQECLEETLLEKGKEALASGDVASAEQMLAEMKSKGRHNSIYTEELANAIKGKKSSGRSSSGSSKSKSEPAAPSQPAMSEKDACKQAIAAKIKGKSADVCKFGKQAQKIGGSSACGGKVKEYLSHCK